ncbi:MAG: CRISPR-associated endonuclease Cas3'', partial [Eubacteriales bacterium]|nr:CRISPR-associated endonuclease Cas3'' [Eubacteriales bacterium]
MKEYFAHKAEDGRKQTLLDHSEGTAERAAKFAESFGFAEEASAGGKFHDAGKYSPIFQRRLDGGKESYEHSSAGMYLFAKRMSVKGSPSGLIDMLEAYIIAGHHSGLPDTGSSADTEDDPTFQAKLRRRENSGVDFEAYKDELGELPALRALPADFVPRGNDPDSFFPFQFLGRMLFSSLVDADFLDTEEFMSDGKVVRDGGESFDVLSEKFERHMEKFSGKTGKLCENRGRILKDCKRAANLEKGVWRLTVPTGGGKTLSSMAFALGHLKKHGMKRIIYVIPYISIIKQTVAIFEDIFGAENVLGHYSTADFRPDENGECSAAELASENWDKPIIVTTNVQFFESLFANRTSSCRKLHNIADSVIIFDEAQMLPVG